MTDEARHNARVTRLPDPSPPPRCWAVHGRELVRCGRGADHDGAHVGMTGQDKFVEWVDA